ncbi:uncharacterized protein LOC110730938 isoform X1 [Chenopodium quinoa]|uniref:uncharacterized protein LOC110730938 isoform X1 n=1 Tax=Chenopodium quinoa TaxID=63459 RepID=UPI000B798AA6|nr:uncharacterized protein LOC110730938 isoform X1 [Chenopodium quinoa]
MLEQNNENVASLPESRAAAPAQGRASSSGKSDSQASVSGSDASALRRSTRGQNNSSPVSLRKSQRLQRQSPPATPPSSKKKKAGDPSPLRRSVRETKSHSLISKETGEKGSPSSKGSKKQTKGSTVLDSSNEKNQKQDKTLKQIAQEVKDRGKQNCSSEVGNKRKKRLDARRYRDMFKPLKKSKVSDSESDKKSRLENCDDSGGSGHEKIKEEDQERSDGEEMNGDCAKDIDDDAGDSNSCEIEDGVILLASRGHDVGSPSSPRIEAVQKSDKSKEGPVNGSAMENLSNQKMQLTLDKLSDDGDGSGCSERGISLGASAVRSEGTSKCAMDVASSVSSSCNLSIFAEDCAKCLRKRRLDYDSLEEELCCCLLNTINDIDNSKDRRQCWTVVTTEFAEDLGRGVKQSVSKLDIQRSTCVTCKLAGKLLHCSGKGCGRSYHPPCSLNPEENIYLSNWYCSDCTKKQLTLGVHSVSEGIESILDVREVDVSNTEGRQKQKQCFVKFKGLAHTHNRWVPELLLVHEASELHAKLGKEKEDSQWNPALAVPHRLLQRRSVIVDDKPIDQEISLESKSQHEWLVKWCGLDYDLATWEPEDLSFFKKPETQRLIEECETRHNKARNPPLSGNNEAQEKRKDSHVNKLREYHHKGHNAVLLDEQDRFVKVIHFVSSLVTQGSRPFLIICPNASLPSWEAEFLHLAASINVVVYGGNADARHIIRSLEFYVDGGQVLLQVLLSSAEAIAEDVEELKGIRWEAVIIDDSQQSCILTHSGCINDLDTGWRLLLMNAHLRDSITDYLNILSLLDPVGANQDLKLLSNSNADIKALKDRLSSFIICARFIEYWVPVEISNIQLERYCYSMLSEFSALRTFWKSDPVGSLRDIIISLRKCCDHPYIVDWQLQESLTKDLLPDARMNVDIRASGKLHFLENLLSELKERKLKVLILFQSTGGTARDATSVVLEDFLGRFGSDSYEAVTSCVIPSKKLAACNQFNRLRERSFFLLETRVCSPAIKLSTVDAVILFDSDWNLHNDLKALQKITIDSKLELIKVFRLYCPFTVEEKVLILAKNDLILDSTLQGTSPSTRHMLLMWGSSNLFSRLDEFHRDKILDYRDNIVFRSSFMIDVSKEIVSLIQDCNNIYSSKYISVARQNGGCYLKCIPLVGEQKIQQEEVPPPEFWTKLLEGKQPQWKYLTSSSQRHRKRVHYSEESPSEVHSDEVAKRRKKMDGTKIDSPSQQTEPRLEKQDSGSKEHQESGDVENLHNQLGDLFEILKPTLLDLCEALLLEDNVKRLAEEFLEYLVKNYRVTREPETTLQAFLLSVCWTAAEELKNKIDHKKSLTIARERLGFNCLERDTEKIISRLKPIMDNFICLRTKNSKSEGNFVESPLGNMNNATVELEEHMKKFEMKSGRQMEKLKNKHYEELEKFEKSWEDLTMKLEKWCKAESTTIRYTHANSAIRIDKLKALDNDYAKKREELEKQKSIKLKELEARQKVEKDSEEKKLAGYVKRLNSLGCHRLLEEPDGKSRVNSEVAEPIGPNEESNGTVGINGNLSKQQSFKAKAIASVLAENLENTDEQRVSCSSDDFVASIENIPASKGPIGLDKESNGTGGINGNFPKQKNPEGEAIVSVLAENLENTDEQIENCGNDDAITGIESVPASNGPDTSTCSPEQPSAPTGQIKKYTTQIDDVIVDRLTAVESNPNNGSSTTGPLLSPIGSFTEHPNAVESQGLGDESHIGVGEQVGPATRTHTAPLGDTPSLNCPNHVPSDLLHNEEARCSTEASFNEWVTHYNDQLGVAPNRLDSQPIGNHTSIVGTTTPRHQDQMGVAPNGRLDMPIVNHGSIVDTTIPRQQDQNRGRVLGEPVSQPFSQMPVHVVPANFFIPYETNAPVARGAVPAHSDHANRVQMPTNSLFTTPNHFDPLQFEVDRIRREMGNLMTIHEQKKSQLKSECDKEIEELVAQIKRNYDKKIDEAEAAFSLKRKELETCQNKVVMHKMLAEAFRSKCTDYKAATKMPQLGNSSSSVEIASQLHSTRPFSPATSPSSVPPSATPPLQAIRPSMTLSAQARISHVDPVALTAGQQQQIRREALAPAPHIQPFRSASSAISSSCMPSDALVPQPPNNPTSDLAQKLPPQPPPLSAPVQLNSRGQSRQEESMGRGTPLSLSLSATQLLMDITRRHDANLRSNNVPSLPSNVRSSDTSRFEEATNVQLSSSNLQNGDVVCLSDDD